jgi:hypothetical protein
VATRAGRALYYGRCTADEADPKPPRRIARPPSRLRNEKASRAAFGKRLGLPPLAEAAGGRKAANAGGEQGEDDGET